MLPVLFRIGPLTVYSYGLMMALGFIAADLICTSEFKRRGLNPDQASMLVLWAALGGIAGSRLYDVIDNWPQYATHPSTIIFSGAGFVWFGGLMGGIAVSFLVVRHYGIKWLVAADSLAPGIAIGQALGRVGCLLSGDGDWGMESKLPWAMSYPHAIVGWTGRSVLALNHANQLVAAPGCNDYGCAPWVRVHPAPIYEALLYTAVCLFLWSIRKRSQPDGRLFYLYLILAGASRFMVEFIRVNPRVWMGLSEAQLIAALMVIGGLVLYAWSYTQQPAALQREAAWASQP
ncbi:MAG TPA: prolipoprotein diacylglyceryl transferase [Candidatus Binataceae bacterium]|nr:prolipoprotein diacylglyceryl transferase [Candidatus Binataceae bacterium]